jgi:hypothetical protein
VRDQRGSRAGTPRNPRRSRLPFVVTYFAVVTAICVLLFGWWGLLVAPLLIAWATASALLRPRRGRGIVGLLDRSEQDFEAMRRAEVTRRRARDGR